MAGIVSEGMMLFSTTKEGNLTPATVAEKVESGTLVR